MANLLCFEPAQLEAVCKVLGDTTNGLKGDEIGRILAEINVSDPDVGYTKWKRLYNAFAHAQNKHQVGNHLVQFVNKAMNPARYTATPDQFNWRRDGLNVALAFAGYAVNESGQVVHATPATTLQDARARAGRLRSVLESRRTHVEVLKYCEAELLQENYFHAVLEAVKGVAERIRQSSGLGSDGAELINQVFSTKAPLIAINALKSETELSEQKGFASMLVGLFGAIRNPTAHAPKTLWAMPEDDAVDILALVSYIHRKLDSSTKI